MNRFGDRYDAFVRAPVFVALYGESGLFNVGLWNAAEDGSRAAPETVVEAARSLVREVVGLVPAEARTVLEVAAGAGGAGREARGLRPGVGWLALDLSLARLASGGGIAVAGDATRLPIREASVDAVVAVEAAFHFDSRAGFLAEARRILRPGGTLLLTDLALATDLEIAPWLVPSVNRVADRAAYERTITGSGFDSVALDDWTARCWAPFLDHLDARDAAREARGEISTSARSEAAARRSRQRDAAHGLVGYFLVRARRPLND